MSFAAACASLPWPARRRFPWLTCWIAAGACGTFAVLPSASQSQDTPPQRSVVTQTTTFEVDTAAISAKALSLKANAKPAIRRHCLIMAGHPGEPLFREEFDAAASQLAQAMITRFGCAARDVHLLTGQSKEAAVNGNGATSPTSGSINAKDGLEFTPAEDASPIVTGPATKELIMQTAAHLADAMGPRDGLWVFVIGHAHYDGNSVWWNLVGPDLAHEEFAKLFRNIRCAEQVFWITTPASGYFLKPLSKPNRVVITATEADLELNATVFPALLGNVLSLGDAELRDVDADSRISLLDIYLHTALRVAAHYTDNELLATEHSVLDDNGDGRGSELQAFYLTPESERKRASTPKPRSDSPRDGLLSATMLIPPLPTADPVSAIEPDLATDSTPSPSSKGSPSN